jgi:3-dehydroquinate dehydratase type I
MGVCGLESKGDSMNQEEKIDHFIWALELGVPLIVIEYTSNFKEYIETALAKIKEAVPFFENKKNLVIEYASFKETPDYEKAKTIVENMFKYSPFLIKLITMANQASDNKIFYRILETYPKQKIIAFGMGDTGLESRINSVHHGSYATYGHFGISSQACPGQIYFKDLADEIAKENV